MQQIQAFLARQRRRWPRSWRLLHLVGWAGSLLAIVTGVAIVWSPLHAALIRFLMDLRLVHSGIGGLVAVALGVGAARVFPRKRNRLDWWPAACLLGALTASGVVLLVPTAVPSTLASLALPVHLWSTWALVGFVAFHVVRKLHLVRFSEAPYLDPRRRFLGSAIGSFLFGALAVLIGPLAFESTAPSTEDVGSWQIYSITGTFPRLTPERYRLRVEGLVAEPRTFDLTALKALPSTVMHHDFHCVTGWVVRNVRWQGVSLVDLMRIVRPLPSAQWVVFYSADRVYVDSLSLEEARTTRALLAYRMGGAPVSQAHGGPVRLFVPDMYGYKSVKWVDRVVFSDVQPLGTWEAYGYPADAWIGGAD